MTHDDQLSPAETARRFGVSIKALRLYEQRGLLTPLRTANGRSEWRVYGPDQIARLHQILALKRLGLTLAQIGDVLAGPADLASVLALQEQSLRRESQRLSKALELIGTARAKLTSGQELSIDDLATLTLETRMEARLSGEQIKQLLEPFMQKHLSPKQQQTLARLRQSRVAVREALERLVGEAEVLMATGIDPAAPPALDIVRRFRELASEFGAGVDGMQEISLRVQEAWADAMDDPDVAAKLANRQRVLTFIRDAVLRLRMLEISFTGK